MCRKQINTFQTVVTSILAFEILMNIFFGVETKFTFNLSQQRIGTNSFRYLRSRPNMSDKAKPNSIIVPLKYDESKSRPMNSLGDQPSESHRLLKILSRSDISEVRF